MEANIVINNLEAMCARRTIFSCSEFYQQICNSSFMSQAMRRLTLSSSIKEDGGNGNAMPTMYNFRTLSYDLLN